MSPEGFSSRPRAANVRQLTHTESYAGSPAFSTDGKQVAFYTASLKDVIAISDPRRQRATTQIAVIDVADGTPRMATSGDGEKWSPRWVTPDSIGYASGGPVSGLEFTTAARKGVRGEFNNPVWSVDGRRMLFHRDTAQAWPPVMETPSPDKRFHLLRAGIFPSFSPSGDRVTTRTHPGRPTPSGSRSRRARADSRTRWRSIPTIRSRMARSR